MPYVNNLVLAGSGPSTREMIAQTERALLVTCFWYIRTVDPQSALLTGLTRDGVFLIEHGQVQGRGQQFPLEHEPDRGAGAGDADGPQRTGAAARAR